MIPPTLISDTGSEPPPFSKYLLTQKIVTCQLTTYRGGTPILHTTKTINRDTRLPISEEYCGGFR